MVGDLVAEGVEGMSGHIRVALIGVFHLDHHHVALGARLGLARLCF